MPRKPSGKKVQLDFLVPKQTCNCKSTSCLKLYCVCFASGRNCDGCSCVECRNTEENSFEVAEEREKILAKNPHAFQDKRNPLVAKGCKCTKSRCIKGYCECFSAGRGCLAICGCQDCANVLGKRPPMPEEADYLAHEPVRVPTKAAAAKAARGPSPPELADAAPKPAPTYNRRPGRHRAHAVSVKRALSSSPTPDSSGSEVERMAAPRKHNLDDLIAATEAVEATGQQDVAEPPPAQQRKLLSGSWEHLLPSVAELQCTAHQTAPPPGLAGASDGPAPRAPYAFQRSDDRCDMKHEPVLEGIAGNG